MNILLNAVYIVLSIMIMLSIGWVLAYKGWVDEKATAVFTKILIGVALPSLMISNITVSFDRDKFLSSGTGLFIGFVTIALSYGVSMAVARIFKIERKRRGTFQVMFAFSNTMYIGLPVNLALFGEDSIPYVLLYYIANTTLFWTIGVYGIRRDSELKESSLKESDGGLKQTSFTWENIKKILSPPIIAFFASIALVLLDIKLPSFIMDPFKYMGGLSTPMSMLFIGAVIYSIGLKNIRFDRDILILLIGRFIITPVIVMLFLYLFNVPALLGKVFIIQSAMPVATQCAVSTRAYGGDYRFASAAVTISTIIGLLFIPFYMYLMG